MMKNMQVQTRVAHLIMGTTGIPNDVTITPAHPHKIIGMPDTIQPTPHPHVLRTVRVVRQATIQLVSGKTKEIIGTKPSVNLLKAAYKLNIIIGQNMDIVRSGLTIGVIKDSLKGHPAGPNHFHLCDAGGIQLQRLTCKDNDTIHCTAIQISL